MNATSKFELAVLDAVDKRFYELMKRIKNENIVNESQQPNGLSDITLNSYLSRNIKNIMSKFAEQKLREINSLPVKDFPENCNLVSKLSTQNDMESDWCRFWLKELKIPFRFHRKNWELAFVLQALFENNMFGKTGLGLACGSESLPSYLISKGCSITAGDKPFSEKDIEQRGWALDGQYTLAREQLYHAELVDKNLFDQKFALEYIDMNDIPQDMSGKYDFCWSVCAIEHIGSIRNGIEFLKNSLKLLKPGGISVHTTEFNLYSDNITIDNWGSVLFTKQHLLALEDEICSVGGYLLPFNFDIGSNFFDQYVDMPPYDHQEVAGIRAKVPGFSFCPHLKLLIDGFPATCAGIIIQRDKN